MVETCGWHGAVDATAVEWCIFCVWNVGRGAAAVGQLVFSTGRSFTLSMHSQMKSKPAIMVRSSDTS